MEKKKIKEKKKRALSQKKKKKKYDSVTQHTHTPNFGAIPTRVGSFCQTLKEDG